MNTTHMRTSDGILCGADPEEVDCLSDMSRVDCPDCIEVRYVTLRRDSRDACEKRGHSMTKFTRLDPGSGCCKIATSACVKCGAQVTIRTDPLPGQPSASGDALTSPCRYRA